MAALEANVAMQRRIGIVTGIVDATEVRRLLPGIDIGDAQVAACDGGAARNAAIATARTA